MTRLGKKIAAKDRVAHGLCPNCGKEAAPYRLCFDCRQLGRITRCLKRGVKHGALNLDITKRYSINKNAPDGAHKQWGKWSTKWNLPESDKRSQPKLRGIRVDVEATLLSVIEFIGRPCTIEEITLAWARLREKRSDPLPNDLARIIKAADKREAKRARRAARSEGASASCQ